MINSVSNMKSTRLRRKAIIENLIDRKQSTCPLCKEEIK